jgi:DnaJ-class molecular chaperone
MKTIKKVEKINHEVYKTADGKEFDSKCDAQLHEDILCGKKKICDKCKGAGKINERWEKEWRNTDWIPTKGEYVDVKKSEICLNCKGKGYLELKWE